MRPTCHFFPLVHEISPVPDPLTPIFGRPVNIANMQQALLLLQKTVLIKNHANNNRSILTQNFF